MIAREDETVHRQAAPIFPTAAVHGPSVLLGVPNSDCPRFRRMNHPFSFRRLHGVSLAALDITPLIICCTSSIVYGGSW
jgi:hypothetical protein